MPPSTRLGQSLPAALERLVLRCLRKQPSERFESASALYEALVACDVPAWTEREAHAAGVRVATHRLQLMATATAPTLPAATPSILAIDVLRREGSDRDA